MTWAEVEETIKKIREENAKKNQKQGKDSMFLTNSQVDRDSISARHSIADSMAGSAGEKQDVASIGAITSLALKKSISQPGKKASNAQKISLIESNTFKSRKAREAKEHEIMKYSQAIQVLKKNLAVQIVNNTTDVSTFKEFTLEDLFKFTADLEKKKSQSKRRDPKSMAERFDALSKEQKERIIWDQ